MIVCIANASREICSVSAARGSETTGLGVKVIVISWGGTIDALLSIRIDCAIVVVEIIVILSF